MGDRAQGLLVSGVSDVRLWKEVTEPVDFLMRLPLLLLVIYL